MKKKNNIKISVNKNIISNKRSGNIDEEKSDENLSKGINILNNYQEKIKLKRDYLKGKTSKQLEDEYIEEENRYSKARPIVLSLIVIIIIIAIYIFLAFGPLVGISLNKNKGIDDNQKIDFASTDEDIYSKYNNELLIYSNQTISTYNSNSKKTWDYKLPETFTPSIYIEGKYMAICNNSSGTIYLFDNKKEILNKKIDGTIQSVYLDDNGNMAIEYSTSGYKRVVGVFSKNGKNIYNAYLPSGSIINIKLLENGKKLLAVQADASSFKIGTVVNLVDGTKENDNIKQIAKLDNNFIFDLTIQGQNIIMLLDNRIVSLNMNTNIMSDIKTFDSSQFLFLSIGNNYYSYIQKDLGNLNNEYKIITSRYDNSIINETSLTTSPKSLYNDGVLNYFIYQDKLQVINKWGVEVKNISIGIPPKDIIIFHDSKSVALIYTNKVYIVNM